MAASNHLLKLFLPIGLAAAAFAGNRAYLMGQKQESVTYVIVTEQLLANGTTTFAEENLSPIEISVTGANGLPAVPWESRAILYGAEVKRDFEAGDLVLLNDIGVETPDLELNEGEIALVIPLEGIDVEPGLLKVGASIGFIVDRPVDAEENPIATTTPAVVAKVQLGPFRIVSVGTEIEGYSGASRNSGRVSTISVATTLVEDNELDATASLLIVASKEGEILAIGLYRYDQRFEED